MLSVALSLSLNSCLFVAASLMILLPYYIYHLHATQLLCVIALHKYYPSPPSMLPVSLILVSLPLIVLFCFHPYFEPTSYKEVDANLVNAIED